MIKIGRERDTIYELSRKIEIMVEKQRLNRERQMDGQLQEERERAEEQAC